MLAIDDDVVEAARRIAAREGLTLDAVVSDLARRAASSGERAAPEWELPVLPRRAGGGTPVTPKMVERLKDELY
jgi:hypothetical protein